MIADFRVRKLHPEAFIFRAGGAVPVVNRPGVGVDSGNSGVFLFLIEVTVKRFILEHGQGETTATHVNRRLRAFIDLENPVIKRDTLRARQTVKLRDETEPL